MKTGDKVVCVDDQGWLERPDYPHLTPKKDEVYTVKELDRFGAILAISLVGGNDDDFYRASRFRLVSEVGHPPVQVEQPIEL